LSDQALKLLLADLARNRVADFLETGEIPKIRKIAALLRLHRLNRAVVASEENALPVGLVPQGQSAPVCAQPRVSLDEFVLAELEEGGEARDGLIIQPHLSGPPATGGAALAFVENRHAGKLAAVRAKEKRGSV
jgi:hypothetical protein